MKLNFRLNIAMTAVVAMAVTALTLVADGRVSAEPTERDVASALEEGDRLVRCGYFDAAREIYQTAEEMVRSAGRLPGRELRRIATAYYFEGRYGEASATLTRLADEAAASKDSNIRALAIADAVWMSALAGSADEMRLRLQLRELFDSSALSEGVRDAIGSDPAGDFRVFAPHLTAG